jgi:hypothetical protein
MKITQADIKAIRAAVREHAPGRAAIEVGVRTHANDGAPTIDSTQWDEDAELDDVVAIREIIGQPKTMGMVLDLYITVPTCGIRNLDAQWVAENRWNVFDPFATPSHGDH